MLYLYAMITPNKDPLNFYYYKDFEKYKRFLSLYLVKTINNDKYTINTEVLRVAIDNNITPAILDNITYIIDEEGNYKRCFHVNSFEYQSGYAIFNLSIDIWGSYIYKATFANSYIQACDRNFNDIWYYKEGSSIYNGSAPNITHLRSDTISNMDVFAVFSIKTNVYQTQDGSTSVIKLLGVNLRNLKTQWVNAGASANRLRLSKYQDFEVVARVLGGIYGSAYTEEQASNFKAEVLNAWLLPRDLIRTYGTYYLASRVGDSDVNNGNLLWHAEYIELVTTEKVYIDQMTEIVDYQKYTNYLGTEYNGLKLINKDIMRFGYRCIPSYESITVIAYQGDNEKDITNSFAIALTNIAGDISPQRQMVTALNRLLTIGTGAVATIGGVVGGALTYNPLVIAGGLFAGVKTVSSLLEDETKKLIGSQVGAGSGFNVFYKWQTFVDNDYLQNLLQPLTNPLCIRSYATNIDINNIVDNCAIYNNKKVNLNDLNLWPIYEKIAKIKTALPNSTDTYIVAKTDVSNINIDASNFIKNVFAEGVLIHLILQ